MDVVAPESAAERVERRAQREAEPAGGRDERVVGRADVRGLTVRQRHQALHAPAEARGRAPQVLEDLRAERLRGVHQHPRHGLHELQ